MPVTSRLTNGFRRFRLVPIASTSILVAGCAALPNSGPTGHSIQRDVTGQDNRIGYQLVDITPEVLAKNLPSGIDDRSHLAPLAADGDVDTVGPGDVLAIEVFEVGAGIFTNNRVNLGVTTSGSDSALPTPSASGQPIANGIAVDRDGYITVPYAGRLHVSGLTTTQVQNLILKSFAGKSQSPQVVVTLVRNVASTVVVMGAVQRPGRYPLSLAHEHLLDMIAEASGISMSVTTGSSTATGTGPQDMIVRFTRGSLTREQRLDSIVLGSPDDLTLLPGDRIDIVRRPRTLTMFGAISHISQLPFESGTLTLAEALARSGGPLDERADPRSVFVFRLENPSAALFSVDRTKPEGPPQAVIYRLNLMRASSYFYAQQFVMHDHDALFIANSSSNQPTKLVQILNLLFTPVYSIREASR